MTDNPILGIALTVLQTILIYGVWALTLYKIIKVEKDTREIKALLAEMKAQRKE